MKPERARRHIELDWEARPQRGIGDIFLIGRLGISCKAGLVTADTVWSRITLPILSDSADHETGVYSHCESRAT